MKIAINPEKPKYEARRQKNAGIPTVFVPES